LGGKRRSGEGHRTKNPKRPKVKRRLGQGVAQAKAPRNTKMPKGLSVTTAGEREVVKRREDVNPVREGGGSDEISTSVRK